MSAAYETGNGLPSSNENDANALHKRIGELIDAVGSVARAAEIANVSDVTIGRWRKGPTMAPFDKVAVLCVAAGIRVDWVATGEGPRDIQLEGALFPSRTKEEHMGPSLRQGMILDEATEDAIALPRLTIEGSAGQGVVPTREEIEDYLSVSRRYLREVGINPSYAHVLRLSGHSMAPTLLDKDLVIVDTSQNRVRDEEIYALAYGDAVLIKRLQPQLDGGMKIISDNKGGHYSDAYLPASDRHQLRVVGRVGGFLRYI
jgi:phage repressor protein C with HTH and peptisase S24 domain